ncbi:HesA/MoeB/ThiF family protein [Rheinheimera soli]|uniref:HesA/MoeB/ThiF family protein n=1 Tax=Rheinheimera soli TaxID=443616 RepID=UPI001E397EA0|nr:molybdopterin-synthase adenylyltransferase MoeB [Rheinheimera soli]
MTEQLRYSRHFLLAQWNEDRQQQLAEQKVLLVGLGGVGSAAAPYLVSSGLGHLTLADFDQISLSNLPRQLLYQDADVGQQKVQVAQQKLQLLNPACSLQSWSEQVTADSLNKRLAEFDLVLDCTDNLDSRQQLQRACYHQQKPLLSAAAVRLEGQISYFPASAAGPCYCCYSSALSQQEFNCLDQGVLSPLVGVIGSLAALEAIKILSGLGSELAGKLWCFDALFSQWQQLQIAKNPHCPVCSVAV